MDERTQSGDDAPREAEPGGGAPRRASSARAVEQVERGLSAIGRGLLEAGPSKTTWRGATLGLALAVAVAYGLHAGWLVRVTSGDRGALVTALGFSLIVVCVGPLLSVLAWSVGWLVVRPLLGLPLTFRWALASAVVAVGSALAFGATRRGALLILVVFTASAALAGGGLAGLLGRGGRARPEAPARPAWRRGGAALALLVGLAGVALQVQWLTSDGPGEPERRTLARVGAASVVPIELPNPGEKGPFAVQSLTYGSGRDPRRPEFGAEADLVAPTVDGSAMLSSWNPRGTALADWPARARSEFFGCGPATLPLQGRVWYPEREEPAPLVLMVHGNHLMSEFSDPGYDYLGELLASRGFLCVSIDQNFLNTNPAAFLGVFASRFGVQFRDVVGALDVRAWLLLEHLRLWRQWNRSGPLAGRVDLGRIALLGHSFGGEAVALAAQFNRLAAHPDNARLRFDYGFDIRSVIAVAPVDGRYAPGGAPALPVGVDYFTLHGSHDMDVQSFEGAKQYQRLELAAPGSGPGAGGPRPFKSALYVYRANHGQFNRAWGAHDIGLFPGRALNVAALLSASEQEQVARIFVSAFLEASLNRRQGYRALLRDARTGRDSETGASWLPETTYVQRYAEAGDRLLCTFEEDADPTTATVAGGRIVGSGLVSWSEAPVWMKRGALGTRAAFLAWRAQPGAGAAAERAPRWRVQVPEGAAAVTREGSLLLSLADARQGPPGAPLDFSVMLEDAVGGVATLPLSHFAALQPTLSARMAKADWFRTEGSSELVLADFSLPLAAFADAAPRFDVTRLVAVSLVFDRSAVGRIALDDLGLRPGQ